MGAWWREARAWWQDVWWGCSVLGWPVAAPNARTLCVPRCTVPGGETPIARWGCPVWGGPGRGAVLTAALEALPAAAPDEVPAEVAPGVEPAASRLEAVPGARCRRQPRVGVRPGAGAEPAGRADAQGVGPLQAAPAQPRLRLQLPQLDELHGPAAAGAARRRGGGRHRGWGRGGDREGPPRPDTAGETEAEAGASRAAPRGPDHCPPVPASPAGRARGGDEAPGAAAVEAGALLQQPCLFCHFSQDRGKPHSVPQFPSGEGAWGNLWQRVTSSQSPLGEPLCSIWLQPQLSSLGSE